MKRPKPEDYRTVSSCIDQISLLRDMDKYIDHLEEELREISEGGNGPVPGFCPKCTVIGGPLNNGKY